jgi:hypothetical protein
VGRCVVTGQLPVPFPRCFGCWRSLRSCGRRRPVHPVGQGVEIFVRKSATKERRRRIPHHRPRRRRGWTGRSGHVQSVRTAAKRRSQQKGQGVADARYLVGAQRKPGLAAYDLSRPRHRHSVTGPGTSTRGPLLLELPVWHFRGCKQQDVYNADGPYSFGMRAICSFPKNGARLDTVEWSRQSQRISPCTPGGT